MLMTLPWFTWLQLRLWWTLCEVLYKPYGLPLYGLSWNRSFKVIWDAKVIFDSCGHGQYWCKCRHETIQG
jgi:hypothetical protein